MTQKRTIGSQLDDLGLTLDLEEGDRVLEATVSLVTGNDAANCAVEHRPIDLPVKKPGSVPVPHPVERRIITVVAENQELSAEQLDRTRTWLAANGIDPALVTRGAITLEGTMCEGRPGCQYIGFQQYYLEDGNKVHSPDTNSAVKFHRYVEQSVELEPDPAWEGWELDRKAEDE